MNKHVMRGAAFGLVLAALTSWPRAGEALPNRFENPKTVGTEPLATTPYARNDPHPKLELAVHKSPDTPQKAAETFLALMSQGYDPYVEGCPGGSLPGNPEAYEQAWLMMTPNKPSLPEFTKDWSGTVKTGLIQFEPINGSVYFFEIERVAWHQHNWNVSYSHGKVTVRPVNGKWLIDGFHLEPEPLVAHNIGGHQGWQHNVISTVRLHEQSPMRDDVWAVVDVQYQGRTATVTAMHRKNRSRQRIRLARLLEGTWLFLQE